MPTKWVNSYFDLQVPEVEKLLPAVKTNIKTLELQSTVGLPFAFGKDFNRLKIWLYISAVDASLQSPSLSSCLKTSGNSFYCFFNG